MNAQTTAKPLDAQAWRQLDNVPPGQSASAAFVPAKNLPPNLPVELPDPCKCGGTIAFIRASSGPHCALLRCESCSAFRGWLQRATYDFLIEIINKFGRPIAPITIRRGERNIKSGSQPESMLPAASRHLTMTQHKRTTIMKKNEIFPSTYYNASDVRDGPTTLTIDYVQMEPVGEGANKTEKAVAHFKEEDSKLLVVSSTKFDAIALIAKSDDTRDWPAVRIVLEAGKATFQGKLVDSVAIRAPRKPAPKSTSQQKKAAAPIAADTDNDLDDSIPD